jgi:1,2-diacylglycerol 3-alpha-glucosyltransferase
MIIALVLDQIDNGSNGIAVSGRQFEENLRRHGHEVRVVATGEPRENKYVLDEYIIPIVTRLARKQSAVIAKPNEKILRQAFEGADVVHFMTFWPLGHKGLKIAREMKIPVTAAFHMQPENITWNIGMGKFELLNRLIYDFLKKTFYRKFNDIHCPSDFIADELRKHRYQAEMHVISNGVGDEFAPREPADPKVWGDRIPILMVGRLSPEKRQDVLIAAIQKSKYADRIQLILAGKGPNEKKYRMLCENLANPPVIDFYSRNDLADIMNSSALYVHASDIEIEGMSCLESFACGLVPVICDSPKSATNAYALTDQNLFRSGDAGDLAQKIDYWLDNPELKKEFGTKYSKIAETLRVEHSVRKTETMFIRAIENFNDTQKNTVVKSRQLLFYKNYPFIPRSIADKCASAIMIRLATPILFILLKMIFGLKVKGRRNLWNLRSLSKWRKGVVTVSNHVHKLDCAMVATALLPWRMYFTSMKKNFETPTIGFLVRNLGGIPIPDNLKFLGYFMEAMEKALEKGKHIHFYPEGSLVDYGTELRPFKKGAFHLAVSTNVPVVPIVITYREPRGLIRLFRQAPSFSIEIGKPVYPNRRNNPKFEIDELMNRTYSIMMRMMGGHKPDKGTTDIRENETISA